LIEALLMNPCLPSVAVLLVFSWPRCLANEVFPQVHKEPIAIRVVDGKQGLPQTGVQVVLIAGYERRDLDHGLVREELRTNSDGVVPLSTELRDLPLLQIQVLKRHACQPASGRTIFSIERIRDEGMNGVNRCGSVAVDEVPGLLTVFVRAKKSGK
jgi:hypothetical protein